MHIDILGLQHTLIFSLFNPTFFLKSQYMLGKPVYEKYLLRPFDRYFNYFLPLPEGSQLQQGKF